MVTKEFEGWTEANLLILRERWRAGDSSAEIADALGTTRNAVLGRLHRDGIRRDPVTWSAAHDRRLRVLVKAKQSLADAAAELGFSRSLVSNRATALGLQFMTIRAPAVRAPSMAQPAYKPPAELPLPAPAGRPVATRPVAFADCDSGRCQFPLWGNVAFRDVPTSERLVCGSPVAVRAGRRGEPVLDVYCQGHLERTRVAPTSELKPGMAA